MPPGTHPVPRSRLWVRSNFAQLHLARHCPAAVINHHMCQPLGLAADLYVSLYPHLHPKLGALLVIHMTHVIHKVVAGLHSLAHVPFTGMIHPALLELGSRRPHGARCNHCSHHGRPPHTHDTFVLHDANIRISRWFMERAQLASNTFHARPSRRTGHNQASDLIWRELLRTGGARNVISQMSVHPRDGPFARDRNKQNIEANRPIL